MITTKAILSCGHFRKSGAGAVLESYHVFPSDRRVASLPLELKYTPVHQCEKLTVVQEYRGINRWFIVRDQSIIQKP
jgi:hypothetical protein